MLRLSLYQCVTLEDISSDIILGVNSYFWLSNNYERQTRT